MSDKNRLRTAELFDFSHSLAGYALQQCEYPWQILGKIRDLILALGQELPQDEYEKREADIWIHKIGRASCRERV